LIEEFVCAVMKRFPKALLQWEDFKKATAFDLLDRYRGRLLSFNDDIQGTAAVALAGVMAATRLTGVPLKDQRVVILGAGAAGIGIGRQLRDALERHGIDDASRVALLDSRGLLIEGRDYRDAYKKEFAWPADLAKAHGIDPEANDLLSVVSALKPHVLIGASGQPGTFTQPVIEAMSAGCPRPVVFPFSNPTSKCEAIPEDLIRWTNGTALVASGSPFDPVVHEGRTHRIGQGNNVYIFPGVGLGALCAEATSVSETMFTVAAETLAANVADEDLSEGSLYPKLTRLRELSAKIAVAVALEAADEKVAPPLDEAEAKRRVQAAMWLPRYVRLEPT
jgi:malate dehydrogenase (oxaloacetate-decarboxylating)